MVHLCSVKITEVVKVVWLIITLLVLSLTFRLFAEDSFWFVILLLVTLLLLGIVLNFSPVTNDNKWRIVGWGMFYGALLSIIFFLVLVAYFFLSPEHIFPMTD